MEIICLGLSHHTAPIDLREKFAVPDHAVAEMAVDLSRQQGLGEAVIVSTCNRVEFYAAAEDPREGTEALARFVAERVAEPEGDAFFRHASQRSINHLFRVVSGLDSMVLGETEILGQVKKAYQSAQQSGATGRHLNKLFQRAFNVAKEVRTNTNITRGSVSVGSVAVWVLYAFILAAEWWHRISPRRGAWLSVGALVVVLCTLWGIRFAESSGV